MPVLMERTSQWRPFHTFRCADATPYGVILWISSLHHGTETRDPPNPCARQLLISARNPVPGSRCFRSARPARRIEKMFWPCARRVALSALALRPRASWTTGTIADFTRRQCSAGDSARKSLSSHRPPRTLRCWAPTSQQQAPFPALRQQPHAPARAFYRSLAR